MLVYNYLIYPLETFYRFVYLLLADWLGNYGTAVIALSLFNFLILYPFTKKAQEIQQEESHLQGILQKQIRDIKDRFSGAEQFEKIQRLYDRYSYHPIMAVRSILGLLIQLPFLLAAFYMLSNCIEIQGVSWGIVRDLGMPDSLLYGINLLPFVMTLVSVLYAHLMPAFNSKQKTQTIAVSVLFLILLYSASSALLMFWTCNILWSLLHCLFAERLRWISDYISENELAFHIIFALALTVGLLVPLELYIKNASELWFSFKYILKYFLSNTAKCILVLVVLYFICWRKKIRVIYLSLLFGLLLGVFLQSYFLNLNYGLIDGHEIKWEEYKWQGIINTFIWLVCLGESFVIFRRLKFDENKIRKYVKPISFGIVAVQCVVLVFSIIKNPLPENAYKGADSISVLTTKNIFNISSKKNIIVFLLDAFDAKIFEEIMVKDPQIIDKFKGFVFYPDTTSVYGYTDYSLPQILTGKIFNNDTSYAEYFERAWIDNEYFQKLEQNNFDVGIYTSGTHVHPSANVSNIINEKIALNDDSMKGFQKLVLFRIAPHIFKKNFYHYDPNSWTYLLKKRNVQVYQFDDKKFYSMLREGLIYNNDKNSFRFYHLTGAHYPFILNRNLELISSDVKGNQYEQSIGVLKIVNEYIEQMKSKGVFSNSTFVVMADHGDHNVIGSRPLFCIKYSDSQDVPMKVSDASISYSQFLPMLFQDHEDSSKFSLNIRKFYIMDKKNLVEYQISGNAKNPNSWNKGAFFESVFVKRDYSYELGKEIVFNIQNQSSERFQLSGWDRMEPYGVWSLGADAELRFRIEDYNKHDLLFQFVAMAYLADLSQRCVNVYVNNHFVTKLIFDNSTRNFSFKVPSDLINDGQLNVHFIIDHTGVSLGYEGSRDLGIFMNKLKIEELK